MTSAVHLQVISGGGRGQDVPTFHTPLHLMRPLSGASRAAVSSGVTTLTSCKLAIGYIIAVCEEIFDLQKRKKLSKALVKIQEPFSTVWRNWN